MLQTVRLSYHKPMVEYLDVAIRNVFPAENKSQIRIIDAGAGTGLVGEVLAKLGYTNVDAIDISQEMLDEAEKKKVYTKFICAPLNEKRNPDIETGAYHALICVGSLYAAHIGAGVLDEMARMVRPGKRIDNQTKKKKTKRLSEERFFFFHKEVQLYRVGLFIKWNIKGLRSHLGVIFIKLQSFILVSSLSRRHFVF